MKRLIFLTEPLSQILLPGGEIGELSATAEGNYDQAEHVLVLQLGSAVHVHGTSFAEAPPVWLPKMESLEEHVANEEATALARDEFHHWAEKVRESIPAELLHVDGARAGGDQPS